MKQYSLFFVALLTLSCDEGKIQGHFEKGKNQVSVIFENTSDKDFYLIGDLVTYCLPDSIYNEMTLDDSQCIDLQLKEIKGYLNEGNIDTLEHRYFEVLDKMKLVTSAKSKEGFSQDLFKKARFIFLPAKQSYKITYEYSSPVLSEAYRLKYENEGREEYKAELYSFGDIGTFKPYVKKVDF
ncbi:MAG: hypothetical protein NXI00_13125 [Cytophagales bacterium]|nr:hypothetical protein [Cytophagales bacterium]